MQKRILICLVFFFSIFGTRTFYGIVPGNSFFKKPSASKVITPVYDNNFKSINQLYYNSLNHSGDNTNSCDPPDIAIAGPNQTICSTTTTMSANTPTAGNGSWTLISGFGVITNSLSPITSITGLGLGNTIFEWAITDGTCTSVADVTITVDANPSTAYAGLNQTICISLPTTTLGANSPAIGTGTWSLLSGIGNITTPNSENTTVTGLSLGLTIFEWTIENGVCPSNSSTVVVQVDAAPSIATAGTNQTICISSPTTTLSANTPSSGIGTWSVISGSAIITNSNSPNSTVTNLGMGTNVLQWLITTNGACSSTSSTMAIVVDQAPSIANAGANQTICISSPTTILSGNIPISGIGTWSVLSGNATITNSNSPNSTVTNLGLGTNILQWLITNNGACSPTSSTMSISVDALPNIANAGLNQNICIASPTTVLSGNIPSIGVGTWSVISGSAIITNSTNPNTTVSGLGLGNNVFLWRITNGACGSTTSSVTIQVSSPPSISNAGSNQTLCISSATANLSGNLPAIGVGVWSFLSGSGTLSNSNNHNSQVSALGLGTNILQWHIANGACAATNSTMSITVDNIPTPAIAGPNQTVCVSSSSVTFTGNSPTVGAGLWSLVSGSATITTPNSGSSAVTNLGLGQNTFAWVINNGSCAPSVSGVTVIVNPLPSIAIAGSNQIICSSSSSITLNGNNPAIGTGTWSVISGTGTISTANSPTTTAINLGLGSNILQWSVGTVGCLAKTSTLNIQVDQAPTIANAGSNQTLCITNPVTTLNANTPLVGNASWSIILGTGVITSSTSPTTSITGLPVGTHVLQWTITNGVCAPSTSTMSIQVDNSTIFAYAGPNQTLCAASPNATMAGNVPTVGFGTWSILTGSGTILSPNSPTTVVTNLATGLNVLQWYLLNGSCSFNLSTVNVSVVPSPGVPNAGSNQTLCITAPTTSISANSPSLGTASWSLVSGSANILTPLSNTSAVSGLGFGDNILAWTMNYNVCSLTSTINLHLDNIPSIANAGANQTICVNNPTTTLSANTPTSGLGSWSIISGSGSVTTPTLATTSVTGLGLGITDLQWTINGGGCGSTTSTMSIQADNVTTIATTGPSQTLCINNPTTILTGNSPGSGTGIWSVDSGTGTITTPSLASSVISNLGVGLTILEWTITNGFCSSSASIAIQVDNLPTLSNAGSNQFVCISSPTTILSGNSPIDGIGTWSVISGNGIIASPNSATSAITSLSIGVNVLEWKITSGTCGSNTSTISIQVDQLPTTAIASPSQTHCFTTTLTNVSGNMPTVGTGSWTLLSGSGIITSPTFTSTSLTNLGIGANVFEWIITNGACAANAASVQIIIDPPPTNSNAGPNQITCISNPNAIMAANNPAVGTGSWSLVAGSGNIATQNLETTAITNLAPGDNVFAWTITNNCASSTSNVTITVNQVPTIASAANNQTICVTNPTAAISGNVPIYGIGSWSLLSGTGTISSLTASTTTLTNLGVGTNLFAWTISSGACIPSTATVEITVNPLPTPAIAGANQNLCITNPTTTLAANNPSIGTGSWSSISGSGIITAINSATTSVSNLGLGNSVFAWTTTNSCGSSISTVTVLVDQIPSTAIVGANQTVCINNPNITVTGNTPTLGIGSWSLVSGGGTITTPTNNSSLLTNLITGPNVFSWQITNGACAASVATVQITVDPLPTNAIAGSNQTICINDAAIMNGNIPVVGNGTWSLLSGTGLINAPNLPNTSITNLGAGNNVFKWDITNNCSSSSATVLVVADQLPSNAVAGSDQNLCAVNTINLSATNPSTGQGSWSMISGTGSVTSPSLNTSSVTGINTGTTSVVWSVNNGVCPASKDTLKIVIDALPTIANAGPDQTGCLTSVTLSGNAPVTGSGNWSILTGNASVTNPTQNNSGVTALSVNTNLLIWTISNGICPASKDTVSITVLPQTLQAFAGNDTIIYSNQLSLNANNPSSGTGSWSLVNGNCNISSPSIYNTLVNSITSEIIVLRWTITGVCGTTQDDIMITLAENELPNAISPNNDGKNDYFEIPFVVSYNKVEIKIVNRWGSLVYENTNYKNNWNGINQSGNALPEDTYFYVLNLDDVLKTGYITLKR